MVDRKSSNCFFVVWIFPLLGGIFLVLVVLTPIAYFEMYELKIYYWIWGLVYMDEMGYDFMYFTAPIHTFISIGISIVILKSASSLINTAFKAKNRTLNFEKARIIWLFWGVLAIILMIIWKYFIFLEINTYLFDYLEFLNFGFAVTAAFIGGGLGIIGSILSLIIKPSPEQSSEQREIFQRNLQKTQQTSTQADIYFCRHCGNKIDAEATICKQCGGVQ